MRKKTQMTEQPDQKPGGHRKGKVALLCVLLCLCVAFGLFVLYQVLVTPPPQASTVRPQNAVSATQAPETETVEPEGEAPASLKEGFYNVLICGTDNEGIRTDTMIIARLDSIEHTIALLSVPRDTLCYPNQDSSVPKLNSIYYTGGLGEQGMYALEDELENMLGFRVDGYVLVDLQAFVEVVDLVGGVEFNVPQDMDYEDPSQDLFIHLKAGQQHLDGEQAIQLCRYRSYDMADIERGAVQRDFLKALVQKCKDSFDLSKVKPMADLFLEYAETDLTLGNIVYFAKELVKCDLANVESQTLTGAGVMIDEISYWVPNKSEALEIVNTWFNPYDTDLTWDDLDFRTSE